MDYGPYGSYGVGGSFKGVGVAAAVAPPTRKRTGPASAAVTASAAPPPAATLMGMPLQSRERVAGGDDDAAAPPAAAVTPYGLGASQMDGAPNIVPLPGGGYAATSAGAFFPGAAVPPGGILDASLPTTNGQQLPVDIAAFERMYARAPVDFVKRFVDYVAAAMGASSAASYYHNGDEYLAWQVEADQVELNLELAREEAGVAPPAPPVAAPPGPGAPLPPPSPPSAAARLADAQRAKVAHDRKRVLHASNPWVVIRANCGTLSGSMAYAWERWVKPYVRPGTTENDVLKHAVAWKAWGDMTVVALGVAALRGPRLSSVSARSVIHTADQRAIWRVQEVLRGAFGGGAAATNGYDAPFRLY